MNTLIKTRNGNLSQYIAEVRSQYKKHECASSFYNLQQYLNKSDQFPIAKRGPLREVVKTDFSVVYIANPIVFVEFLPNTIPYLSVLLNTPQSDCLP